MDDELLPRASLGQSELFQGPKQIKKVKKQAKEQKEEELQSYTIPKVRSKPRKPNTTLHLGIVSRVLVDRLEVSLSNDITGFVHVRELSDCFRAEFEKIDASAEKGEQYKSNLLIPLYEMYTVGEFIVVRVIDDRKLTLSSRASVINSVLESAIGESIIVEPKSKEENGWTSEGVWLDTSESSRNPNLKNNLRIRAGKPILSIVTKYNKATRRLQTKPLGFQNKTDSVECKGEVSILGVSKQIEIMAPGTLIKGIVTSWNRDDATGKVVSCSIQTSLGECIAPESHARRCVVSKESTNGSFIPFCNVGTEVQCRIITTSVADDPTVEFIHTNIKHYKPKTSDEVPFVIVSLMPHIIKMEAPLLGLVNMDRIPTLSERKVTGNVVPRIITKGMFLIDVPIDKETLNELPKSKGVWNSSIDVLKLIPKTKQLLCHISTYVITHSNQQNETVHETLPVSPEHQACVFLTAKVFREAAIVLDGQPNGTGAQNSPSVLCKCCVVEGVSVFDNMIKATTEIVKQEQDTTKPPKGSKQPKVSTKAQHLVPGRQVLVKCMWINDGGLSCRVIEEKSKKAPKEEKRNGVKNDKLGQMVFVPYSLFHVFSLPNGIDPKTLLEQHSINVDGLTNENSLRYKALECIRNIAVNASHPSVKTLVGRKLAVTILLADYPDAPKAPGADREEKRSRPPNIIATNHPALINMSSLLPSRFIPKSQIYPFLLDASAGTLRNNIVAMQKAMRDQKGDGLNQSEVACKLTNSPIQDTIALLVSGKGSGFVRDRRKEILGMVTEGKASDMVISTTPLDLSKELERLNKKHPSSEKANEKREMAERLSNLQLKGRNVSLGSFPRILGTSMVKPGMPATGFIRGKELNRENLQTANQVDGAGNKEFPTSFGPHPIKVMLSSTLTAVIPTYIMDGFSEHVVKTCEAAELSAKELPGAYRLCKDYINWRDGTSPVQLKNCIFPVCCETINVVIASVALSGQGLKSNVTVIAVPFLAEEMNSKVLDSENKDLLDVVRRENTRLAKTSKKALRIMKPSGLFGLSSSLLALELCRRTFEESELETDAATHKFEKLRRLYNKEFLGADSSESGERQQYLNIANLFSECFSLVVRAALFLNNMFVNVSEEPMTDNEEMKGKNIKPWGNAFKMSVKLPLKNFELVGIPAAAIGRPASSLLAKTENLKVKAFIPLGVVFGRCYGAAIVESQSGDQEPERHIVTASIDVFDLTDVFSIASDVERKLSSLAAQNGAEAQKILGLIKANDIETLQKRGIEDLQDVAPLYFRTRDASLVLSMRKSVALATSQHLSDQPKVIMPFSLDNIKAFYGDRDIKQQASRNNTNETGAIHQMKLLLGIITSIKQRSAQVAFRNGLVGTLSRAVNEKELFNSGGVILVKPTNNAFKSLWENTDASNLLRTETPDRLSTHVCSRDSSVAVYKTVLAHTKATVGTERIVLSVSYDHSFSAENKRTKQNNEEPQENDVQIKSLVENEQIFVSNGRTFILPNKLANKDHKTSDERVFYFLVSFGDTFVVSEYPPASFASVRTSFEGRENVVLTPFYDVFGLKLCLLGGSGGSITKTQTGKKMMKIVSFIDEAAVPLVSSLNRVSMDFYNNPETLANSVTSIDDLTDPRISGHAVGIIKGNTKSMNNDTQFAVDTTIPPEDEKTLCIPLLTPYTSAKREIAKLVPAPAEKEEEEEEPTKHKVTQPTWGKGIEIGRPVLIDAASIKTKNPLMATCKIRVIDTDGKTPTGPSYDASIPGHLVSDVISSSPIKLLTLLHDSALRNNKKSIEAVVYYVKQKSDGTKTDTDKDTDDAVLQLPNVAVSLRASDLTKGKDLKGPQPALCPHRQLGTVSSFYYKQSRKATNSKGVSLPPIHYLVCGLCGEHVICLPRDETDHFQKEFEITNRENKKGKGANPRLAISITKNGREIKAWPGDVIRARYVAEKSEKSHFGLVAVKPSVVSNDDPVNEELNTKRFYSAAYLPDGIYHATVTSNGIPKQEDTVFHLDINDTYPTLHTRCVLDKAASQRFKLVVGSQFLVVYNGASLRGKNSRYAEKVKTLLEKNIVETLPVDEAYAAAFAAQNPTGKLEELIRNSAKEIPAEEAGKESREDSESEDVEEMKVESDDDDEKEEEPEKKEKESNLGTLFAGGRIHLDDFLDETDDQLPRPVEKKVEEKAKGRKDTSRDEQVASGPRNETFYELMISENPSSSYPYIQYAQYVMTQSSQTDAQGVNTPARVDLLKAMEILNRATRDDKLMEQLGIHDVAQGVSAIPLTDEFDKERFNILVAKALLIFAIEEEKEETLGRSKVKGRGKEAKGNSFDATSFPLFKEFVSSSMLKVEDRVHFVGMLGESLCSQCSDKDGKPTPKRPAILYLVEHTWKQCGTKETKKNPKYWLGLISHILRNEALTPQHVAAKTDTREDTVDPCCKKAHTTFTTSLLSLSPSGRGKKTQSCDKATVEYKISYIRLQFRFGDRRLAQEEMEKLAEDVEAWTVQGEGNSASKVGVETLRRVLMAQLVYSMSYLSLEAVNKAFRRCISNKVVSGEPKVFFDVVTRMNNYVSSNGTERDVAELKALVREFVHK